MCKQTKVIITFNEIEGQHEFDSDSEAMRFCVDNGLSMESRKTTRAPNPALQAFSDSLFDRHSDDDSDVENLESLVRENSEAFSKWAYKALKLQR